MPSAQAGPDDTSVKFAGGWGYESDGPLDWQLLGARYYDPGVGRFISPDPIGYLGGLNLYAYCFGDPVNAVDPSGLTPVGGAVVGGIVGGAWEGYWAWKRKENIWPAVGKGSSCAPHGGPEIRLAPRL